MPLQYPCHSISIGEFLDNILDVLVEGVYITDVAGKTLKVNKPYEKLSGLKKEELIGRYVTDLTDEGTFSVVLNPLVVGSGLPQTAVQTTKVGRKVFLSGHPIFDQSGNIVMVVTFVRDLTLMSDLKEQIAHQQGLIDSYHSFVKKKSYQEPLLLESKAIRALDKILYRIAQTDATVLILGETGVGKDILARRIQENSLRTSQPYLKVDCGSIPENLIESELFGYEAGAFSGANSKGKVGYFEMADKGTLFLDEIGELPLPMQAKLLRILQDQELIRIGSTRVKKVDIRFIAATNRNLETAVKEGRFRSDLFYRLQVATLHVPPLRERKEDILPLTYYFIDKYSIKYRKKVGLSKDVEEVFKAYSWPGNIRQLENLIQSLVITTDTAQINLVDLPNNMLSDWSNLDKQRYPIADPTNNASLTNDLMDGITLFGSPVNLENKSLNDIMSQVEKELLKRALDQYGCISEMAQRFNVDRTTIFRKAKKYNLI